MNNLENLAGEDPEDLLDLLENIVACYQDNDSRPADALTLYRQRVKLGASYRVKVAKRFVVVEGGGNSNSVQRYAPQNDPTDKRHLRLVGKGPTLTLLP